MADGRSVLLSNDSLTSILVASDASDVHSPTSPETLAQIVQGEGLNGLLQLGGVRGVADLLATDLQNGLSVEPHENRRLFGSNTYPRKTTCFLSSLKRRCSKSTAALMIMIAVAVLLVVLDFLSHKIHHDWCDCASIVLSVMLVVLVQLVCDYWRAIQFRAMREEAKEIQTQVVRGGRNMQLSRAEVVVGDIVSLRVGEQVPADGLFVRGHSLCIDEANMTGVSEQKCVSQRMPFLMSGTMVKRGQGSMLVTAVGERIMFRRQVMAAFQEEYKSETPLKQWLHPVIMRFGWIGLIVASLMLIVQIIFYFAGHTEGLSKSGKFNAVETKASLAVTNVVHIFSTAVAMFVIAFPDCLVEEMNQMLATVLKKMRKCRVLVRQLSAVEKMATVTTICVNLDTLTLNQMPVIKAWVGGKIRETIAEVHSIPRDLLALLHEAIALTSSGNVFIPAEGGTPEVTGDPMEKELLRWGLDCGMNFELMRSKWSILQVKSFNSEEKCARFAAQVAGTSKVHIHWKGAAEIVLNLCDMMLHADLPTAPITEERRTELVNMIDGMAAHGLRCIAFAYRELESGNTPEEHQEEWTIPEAPLTLIAVVVMKLACRPEVVEYVMQSRAAGVEVCMVTGENLATAKAIAVNCGILEGSSIAIEGRTFRDHSMGRLESPRISVMARCSPLDKLGIVEKLKDYREVLAFIGSGTDDGPALSSACVGLLTGSQMTEAAKMHSDILILNSTLVDVVKVVQWGRSVYGNMQKCIQFHFSATLAALTITFIAAVCSGKVPLTAVQLLLVYLLLVAFGMSALAAESPTNDLMCRSFQEPLFSNEMRRSILALVIYQVVMLLALQFKGKDMMKLTGDRGDSINKTVVFNAFMFCQIFNVINARRPQDHNIFRGLSKVGVFHTTWVITLVVQVIIVEFLYRFASTVKLGWEYWLICISIGLLSWLVAFFAKPGAFHLAWPSTTVLKSMASIAVAIGVLIAGVLLQTGYHPARAITFILYATFLGAVVQMTLAVIGLMNEPADSILRGCYIVFLYTSAGFTVVGVICSLTINLIRS